MFLKLKNKKDRSEQKVNKSDQEQVLNIAVSYYSHPPIWCCIGNKYNFKGKKTSFRC